MDAGVEEEWPRNGRAAVTRSRDRAGQTDVLYASTVLFREPPSSSMWFGHRGSQSASIYFMCLDSWLTWAAPGGS